MVIFHMLRAYSEFKLWQEATRVHTNNEDSNPKTFSFRIIMLTNKRVNLRQELLEYFRNESKALYPIDLILVQCNVIFITSDSLCPKII